MLFHLHELRLTLHVELLELLSGKAVYEPDHDNKLDAGATEEDDPPRKASKRTKARTTKSTTSAANEEDPNAKESKRTKARFTKSTARTTDEEDPNKASTETTTSTKKKIRKKTKRSLELIPDEDDMVGQESGPSTAPDILDDTFSGIPVPTQTDGQTAQPHSLSSLTFS
jgi:hypothetical protein